MVLWVVLKEKEDVATFSEVFEEGYRLRVVDNVWLVHYEPPEGTPNPCEHFRDQYKEMFEQMRGQLVVGYVQAIAGFGDGKFAEEIEKLAAAAENLQDPEPGKDDKPEAQG